MIKAKSEPIVPAEDTDLRQWLGKSGAQIMQKVIEGKMIAAQLKHLEDAMQSSQYPLKLDASSEALRTAIRYQTFLEVWKELNDQPVDTPFETVKLTT